MTKTEKSARSGCHSIEGVKPGNPNWSNQDNFVLMEDVAGNSALHVWGVFDGHGGDGHHVSKMVRERLGQVWLDNDQNMPRAFKQMQAELDKAPFDTRCAGATVVMVAMRNGNLEVGNCGDSRAVLGRKHNGQVLSSSSSSSFEIYSQVEGCMKRGANCYGNAHVLAPPRVAVGWQRCDDGWVVCCRRWQRSC